MTPVCFFADLPGAGPCDGRLVKCHLIPAQLVKRELGKRYVWDPRLWVPGCGGPMKISGHHGRFDSKGCSPLRVPRDCLPAGLEEFAAENDLAWYLDRTYGLPGGVMA